jgi:CDP-diglyceride synthetase
LALSNLAQRFLVALVAVPILLLALYTHRPEPTWAIVFIASLLAMREFFAMTLPAEDRRPALVLGAVACLAFYWCDMVTLLFYGDHVPHALRNLVVGGNTVALFLAVVAPGL